MSEIMNHQRELENKLWAMANALRGNMEAYEFKNYILGTIFYYYLSERTEKFMAKVLKDDGMTYVEAWTDEEMKEAVIEEALNDLGFVIEPQYLFREMVKLVENNKFDVEFMQKAINSLMESTMGTDSEEAFNGLFDDMQLDSTKLGKTVKERSATMSKIVASLEEITFGMEDTEIDILGNAYEYLIGQFAATAGKKAGEFYTPAGPAKLLCELAADGLTDVKSACDPTCGSGSLLLRLGNYANVRIFDGCELTSTTYNLCRMNMILRGIPYTNFHIKNQDTLGEDPFGTETKYRVQVANPPYSAKWTPTQATEEDPRFSVYGKLAPNGKADFAFVQHMIHHMDDDGRIAVLLPHGALFRGGAEETIRKFIIDNLNVLDAVIGLPANLFFGTPIPVCAVVLKQNRNGNSGNVLFIDASKDFEQGKNQNILTDENIKKIVEVYKKREDIERFSHVASIEEIKNNNYKLNILAYVKLNQVDDDIDISSASNKLKEIAEKREDIDKKLMSFLQELGIKSLSPADLLKITTGTIRFKDSTGEDFPDWEVVPLSKVLTETKLKSDGKLRICSVAVNEGVVDQIEHLGRSYAADDTSNYGRVKYGDVVYTKSPTGDFPFGIIKQSQLDEDVAVSPLYGVFKPQNYYLGLLLHFYFESPANANNFLAPIIQKGAKNTINITNETFLTGTLRLPMSFDEQKKIAEFVQVFNEKLKLEESSVYSWKVIKKGLLQQMFYEE